MERLRWLVVPSLFAIAFLALHLPYLPRSLEDVDSINFALGIRDFDVAEHQPHPPGYPVFILAAKVVNRAVGSEASTLALLGIVAGALSAFALAGMFSTLVGRKRQAEAAAATALTMTAPLFWITAARPLSDMTGLAAALFVQWLIVRATSPRALMAAAFLTGLGAGIRSQVIWLTIPLLVFAVARGGSLWARPASGGESGRPSSLTDRVFSDLAVIVRLSASFTVGVMLWAVPLVILSGGPAVYWRAVRTQGSEDLSGVTMLWTTPTVRQFASALYHACVAPWAVWPVAAIVLALALAGLVRVARDDRPALVTLAAAFGPYLVFDFLFQETVTTRYALPLVVPVAYLAVRGASSVSRGGVVGVAAALAAFNLVVAQRTLAAYSRRPAPAFRMLSDMRAATATDEREAPVLATHFEFRRPITWMADRMPPITALEPRPRHEWLELVKYWNGGGRAPAWFAANPVRSDLVLVDHEAPRARYDWEPVPSVLFDGIRPKDAVWYSLTEPGWYLGEGWALTPQTAGVAHEDRKGPGIAPIEGWIRRRPEPITVMIGGRNLAGQGGPVKVRVALDGRTIEEIDVPPGFFLRFTHLPAGALAGSGDYATLTIAAESEQIAIEQFDAQAAGEPMFGFAEGWHEHEHNPATGQQWRWTSDRAIIRVRPEGRALTLVLRGESESPARSHVVVRAGDRVISDQTIDRTLSVNTRIPAATFAEQDGTIVIETDQAYVPAETRWRSRDRRRLGLKILECTITPAS